MHLVTLLLPVRRNDALPQPRALFAAVRRWWQDFRACLERRFDQGEIVGRGFMVERP